MGFIKNQLLNVVEWTDAREGVLFWKWDNDEIKKGSKLIIRPGQDAIFVHNGAIEGIFEDDGTYDIETEIIPFLTTLKSFKFGFNTPFKAEVLFVNTREHLVKWGTKNAINLPAPGLPGGMPIRAFGTFSCKVGDNDVMIDKLAGISNIYTVENVKERITASLDQLLMGWIAKEGKDMFNLQANAFDISEGIKSDLDMQTSKYGISITGFSIMNFNYPEEVQQMITKNAAQAMVGDVNRYQTLTMTDAMADGKLSGGNSTMGNMAEMMMGMTMANQMMNNMNMNGQQPQQNMGMQQQPQQNMGMQQPQQGAGGDANIPKFCPNCGSPTNGAKFCANCGNKLA
jgi:membrane protease subunit (stomatin/prohibitin family)